MKQTITTLIACLALVGSASVLASDIYKYTDENGNIHYGDRPTGTVDETRVVAIVSKPTDNASVQKNYQARYSNKEEQQSSGSGADSESQGEEKLTRAERIAARQEKEATCERYRDRLETLITARRVYRHGDDGERVYLNDAETQEAREKAEELVELNCN
jgi:hypothetical protein